MASISSILKEVSNELKDNTKVRYILQLATGLGIKQNEPFHEFVDVIIDTDRMFHAKSYLATWSKKGSISSHRAALSALSASCDLRVVIDEIGAEKTAALKERIGVIRDYILNSRKEFMSSKNDTREYKCNEETDSEDSEVNEECGSQTAGSDGVSVNESAIQYTEAHDETSDENDMDEKQLRQSSAPKDKSKIDMSIVSKQQETIQNYKRIVNILVRYIEDKDPAAAIMVSQFIEELNM